MENEKLDQQLKILFQKFWDENHIRIGKAIISVDWVDISSIGSETDFKIDSLVIKTN